MRDAHVLWTNLLVNLGFTRDDLTWAISKWASVVVLLASFGADVTKYGIPAAWVPKIQLLALILGVFSATQQTSKLPGKEPGKDGQ
jgi:hypothetical protein